ncbi:hotdog family protein [Flexivirga lutea]
MSGTKTTGATTRSSRFGGRRTIPPRWLARGMSLYPPLLGAGIRVREFSDDWTVCRTELRLNRFNRNQQGTAFGGSIGSMSDAFFALLLWNQLGKGYYVWDTKAEIDYLSPGTSTVHGRFEVPREVAEEVRAAAESGQKVLRWFETDLTLDDGTVVAHVRRQVYVRKRQDHRG